MTMLLSCTVFASICSFFSLELIDNVFSPEYNSIRTCGLASRANEERTVLRIILVRHGQTMWNAGSASGEHFRGQIDVDLNETGRAQAQAVAGRLAGVDVAALYASPLQRAIHTAQPLAERRGLEVRPFQGLLDINYGEWGGRSFDDVAAQWPRLYAQWLASPHQVQIPGGESLADVRSRVGLAIEEVVARHDGEIVVLVGHQVVNKVLICFMLGLDNSAFWRIRQDTCCINRFDHHDGVFTVLTLNEVDHLPVAPAGLGQPLVQRLAGIDHAARVGDDDGVSCFLPHGGVSVPVEMQRGVFPPAGVDANLCTCAQVQLGKEVHVALPVAQRPAFEGKAAPPIGNDHRLGCRCAAPDDVDDFQLGRDVRRGRHGWRKRGRWEWRRAGNDQLLPDANDVGVGDAVGLDKRLYRHVILECNRRERVSRLDDVKDRRGRGRGQNRRGCGRRWRLRRRIRPLRRRNRRLRRRGLFSTRCQRPDREQNHKRG